MDFRQAILARLQKAQGNQPLPQAQGNMGNINDPRGLAGILSRGANVYNGGSMAAQRGGGPQFGRPVENRMTLGVGMNPNDGLRNAIARRLGG